MNNQSNLEVKKIDFIGSELIACRDNDTGKIYVGVSLVCNGIGFNKNEKDRQVKNVKSDIVLKEGSVKFDAGVFDPNNETIALELDYIPLWLAKISITPTMRKDKPEVVERLVQYQLEIKDAIASYFSNKENGIAENSLEIQRVQFMESELVSIKDNNSGKIYAGVKNICNGLGLSLGQYQNETKRFKNDEVLMKGVANLQHLTNGGIQTILALELDYIPLWLAKITITPTMKKDNPELAGRLIEYQLKVKDILAQAFIYNNNSRTTNDNAKNKFVDTTLQQHFNIAETIVQYLGVKKGIAYATAIEAAEEELGKSLDKYKKLLPEAEHDIGYLNATELGNLINKKARDVNIKLQEKGLQCKDAKNTWRLTDEGKNYGEEFPFNRNGHSDYQIRWNRSVVEIIN